MPLQGTFDVVELAETLRLLSHLQRTGRLHVRSRKLAANIFFESGVIIGADESEHQVAACAGDVRGRLEEICFELLDLTRGSFEFQLGPPATLETERFEVETVLVWARSRRDEWQRLRQVIPSLDVQPRLSAALDRPEVTLDQERWRMLTVMDGRRSLRAIGRVLDMSDFDVCRVVKAMLDDGVVELTGRVAWLAAADADPEPIAEEVEAGPHDQASPAAPASDQDHPADERGR